MESACISGRRGLKSALVNVQLLLLLLYPWHISTTYCVINSRNTWVCSAYCCIHLFLQLSNCKALEGGKKGAWCCSWRQILSGQEAGDIHLPETHANSRDCLRELNFSYSKDLAAMLPWLKCDKKGPSVSNNISAINIVRSLLHVQKCHVGDRDTYKKLLNSLYEFLKSMRRNVCTERISHWTTQTH